MVGVAIKLNLYNPAAGGNEFFAKDQRLLLGIPLALLFGIQGSHAFVVDWHNYSHPNWVSQDAGHLVAVIMRIVLTAAHILTCFAHLEPFQFVPIQASRYMTVT